MTFSISVSGSAAKGVTPADVKERVLRQLERLVTRLEADGLVVSSAWGCGVAVRAPPPPPPPAPTGPVA